MVKQKMEPETKWILCQACNTFHAEDEDCPECHPVESGNEQ